MKGLRTGRISPSPLRRRCRCRAAPRQKFRYSRCTPAHGRQKIHCRCFLLHQSQPCCRRRKGLRKSLSDHLPLLRRCRCRAVPRQKFRYSRYTPAHGRRRWQCRHSYMRQWPRCCRQRRWLQHSLIHHPLLLRRCRCRAGSTIGLKGLPRLLPSAGLSRLLCR